MWYFTRPSRPRSNTVPSRQDQISRSDFHFHLVHEKHFQESFTSTFRRWYYLCLVGAWPSTLNTFEQKRIRKQYKDVNDLLDKALNPKYEYLIIARTTRQNPMSSEIFLTTDWRGRNFVYNPLAFFNAFLKEYGYVVSFISGVGGATLLWLIKYFLF